MTGERAMGSDVPLRRRSMGTTAQMYSNEAEWIHINISSHHIIISGTIVTKLN
jgi:hypothetical protein